MGAILAITLAPAEEFEVEGVFESRDAGHVAATPAMEQRSVDIAEASEENGEVGASRVVSRELVGRQMAALPTIFERNEGQWPSEVKFGARGHGITAAFTNQGFTLSARARDDAAKEFLQAIEFDFFPEGGGSEPQGEKKLPGIRNYFLGNDPEKWRSRVPLFEAVRYHSVADGVAMVVTDRDGRLEYDLHVEPGADVGKVDVTCRGADAIAIDPDGSLRIETKAGTLRQSPPKAWYELSSSETKVADCRFRLTGPSSYGFEVVNPIRGSRLIVDPALTWSTYIGGSEMDNMFDVAFFSDKLTVTGDTLAGSTPFPTTPGAYQLLNNGATDVFVSRFDPSLLGSAQLVWSTLIGGTDDERGLSVGVFPGDENAAVCGWTHSVGFPVVGGYLAPHPFPGGAAAFVCRLSNDGATLHYSTFYGGTDGITLGNALAIGGSPPNYPTTIVGETWSSNLPLTPSTAYDLTYDLGSGDAYVARFDTYSSGSSSLLYGSYIGGTFTATSYDEAFAVALDGVQIYIGGFTLSTGFHTTPNAKFPSYRGGFSDGFLMYIDPTLPPASQLQYATFLGGISEDRVRGLAVHMGIMYACGLSASVDFPYSLAGAPNFQEADSYQFPAGSAGTNAFITKLNPGHATQIRYSTFLGGYSGTDIAYDIARIADRAVVVVGMTTAPDFPVGDYSGGTTHDTTLGGLQDGFLTRLVWKASRTVPNQLDYSTHLGGGPTGGSAYGDEDEARALSVDAGEVYVGGWTRSTTFPVTGNGYDTTYNGGSADGFASRFVLGPVGQ
jgi:hypothetical protein